MSSVHPPLTCKDVKQILKNLGFEPKDRKGTSHEQWIKRTDDNYWRVTVDCPKAPFSAILIDLMAKQAGVSKKVFYASLHK